MSLPRCFIVVWAAQAEVPVLACSTHSPAAHSAADVPPVNLVALFRFFGSLRLLSAARAETSTSETAGNTATEGGDSGNDNADDNNEAVEDRNLAVDLVSFSLPSEASLSLVPCAVASTRLFHVAALAVVPSRDSDTANTTPSLLRWVAAAVAAHLHPATWRADIPSHGSHADTAVKAAAGHSSESHRGVGDRLRVCWTKGAAAAQAKAVEMERYGAHDVLADGGDAASLSSLLKSSDSSFHSCERAVNDGDAVRVAVQAYLTRWWLPCAGGSAAAPDSPTVRLAGHFGVVPSPRTAPATSSSLSPSGTTRMGTAGRSSLLPPHALQAPLRVALELLQSFCQYHHHHNDQQLLLSQQANTAAAVRHSHVCAVRVSDFAVLVAAPMHCSTVATGEMYQAVVLAFRPLPNTPVSQPALRAGRPIMLKVKDEGFETTSCTLWRYISAALGMRMDPMI